MANRWDRIIRGMRTPLRTNTIIGRTSPGEGPAEMLSISEVLGLGASLGDLNDVELGTLSDGEVLAYEAASGKWKDAAAGGGGGGVGTEVDQQSAGSGIIQCTSMSLGTYTQIKVLLTDVTVDTDDVFLYLQFADGGVFQTSGYYYHVEVLQSNTVTKTSAASETGAGIYLTNTGASRGIGNAAGEVGCWEMNIGSFKTNELLCDGRGVYINQGAHTYGALISGGANAVFTSLDGIKLLASSGNIDGGTMTVIGY